MPNLLNEREQQPLDEYQIGDGESLLQALVSRFAEIDSERDVQNNPLQELVDVDSLSTIIASDNVNHVSAVFWGHPTYITSNKIIIYPSTNS
ncbi:hypothetical protein [Halobellus captivus]|uniref:hypothetical protein n=1 Tax=Halobellus captivus TaxID=2592614 RepID=UPI0011A39241|nr:hypothetical protein [Halobellus captivus]